MPLNYHSFLPFSIREFSYLEVGTETETNHDLRRTTPCVEAMIPYFFDGGHVHYACHVLYYLRSSLVRPADVRSQFENGKHAIHHNPGIWNGIWSDMVIETTYMRMDGVITGVALNDECVKTWTYGIHICSTILLDLDEM